MAGIGRTPADRVRIANRMVDDLTAVVRSLKDELECYKDCFAPTERRKILQIIEKCEETIELINDNL